MKKCLRHSLARAKQLFLFQTSIVADLPPAPTLTNFPASARIIMKVQCHRFPSKFLYRVGGIYDVKGSVPVLF